MRGIKSDGRGIITGVMFLSFDDEKMEEYWNSLPPEARALIRLSGAEIDSLGMLQKLGEYYKNDSSLK